MTNTIKPPIWFWVASIIALLWNGMGVYAYLQQAYNTESFRAQYTAEELKTVLNTPSWVMGAFAVAVFFGFLASILLLLRKRFAYVIALISLIAVIAQMSYLFFGSTPSNIILPLFVLVFSVFLLWFSKTAMAKGWIS